MHCIDRCGFHVFFWCINPVVKKKKKKFWEITYIFRFISYPLCHFQSMGVLNTIGGVIQVPYMTMLVWLLFCAKFKTDVCSYLFLMEILFSLVDFHLLLWGSQLSPTYFCIHNIYSSKYKREFILLSQLLFLILKSNGKHPKALGIHPKLCCQLSKNSVFQLTF